ncbi:zinc finger protein 239-like isoform X2 [Malaya genurostris]|uniref:zinc finger protein 239-like isoform X2 n=1 Tax=Malaya genurostris TaxID=325434 RepID=UPI0026F3EE02|nr:zinc finger protein 239-like isoform X2 [Malaya genurostris]
MKCFAFLIRWRNSKVPFITENDYFSRNICNACMNDLLTTVRFRLRCMKTEDILRNIQIDIEKPLLMTSDTSQINLITNGLPIVESNIQRGLSAECDSADVKPKMLEDVPVAKPRRPRTTGPRKCDICGKMFSRASYLSKHYRIHTGERPYKCSFCPRAFATSTNFRKHERVHTNDRPHECEECDKRFVSNSHLKEHRRIHTGERPFQCDICGKDFKASSHLAAHRMIHTGERAFECEFCDKSFSKRNKLSTHMLTHTGERPYQCDICGKTIQRKDFLRIHMRTHVGTRKCKICGLEFLKGTPLALHRKVHKKEAFRRL